MLTGRRWLSNWQYFSWGHIFITFTMVYASFIKAWWNYTSFVGGYWPLLQSQSLHWSKPSLVKAQHLHSQPPIPPYRGYGRVRFSTIPLLLTPSNMTDFHESWNLSLMSSNEHIQNMIKDPRPSQEPPHPPKLQQSGIILLEGSWHVQTWWI